MRTCERSCMHHSPRAQTAQITPNRPNARDCRHATIRALPPRPFAVSSPPTPRLGSSLPLLSPRLPASPRLSPLADPTPESSALQRVRAPLAPSLCALAAARPLPTHQGAKNLTSTCLSLPTSASKFEGAARDTGGRASIGDRRGGGIDGTTAQRAPRRSLRGRCRDVLRPIARQRAIRPPFPGRIARAAAPRGTYTTQQLDRPSRAWRRSAQSRRTKRGEKPWWLRGRSAIRARSGRSMPRRGSRVPLASPRRPASGRAVGRPRAGARKSAWRAVFGRGRGGPLGAPGAAGSTPGAAIGCAFARPLVRSAREPPHSEQGARSALLAERRRAGPGQSRAEHAAPSP